jgi:hypothetical protein
MDASCGMRHGWTSRSAKFGTRDKNLQDWSLVLLACFVIVTPSPASPSRCRRRGTGRPRSGCSEGPGPPLQDSSPGSCPPTRSWAHRHEGCEGSWEKGPQFPSLGLLPSTAAWIPVLPPSSATAPRRMTAFARQQRACCPLAAPRARSLPSLPASCVQPCSAAPLAFRAPGPRPRCSQGWHALPRTGSSVRVTSPWGSCRRLGWASVTCFAAFGSFFTPRKESLRPGLNTGAMRHPGDTHETASSTKLNFSFVQNKFEINNTINGMAVWRLSLTDADSFRIQARRQEIKARAIFEFSSV